MHQKSTIQSRHDKLIQALVAADLDGIVLNPSPNLYYLTGLKFHLSERPIILIIAKNQVPSLILPELESAKISDLVFPIRGFTYGEDPDTWLHTFNKAADELNLCKKKIAVDPRSLRFFEHQFLTNAFTGSKFIDASHVLSSLRMFKSEEEISYMQEATEIAEKALLSTIPIIKEGRTEKEIALELSIQLLTHGSEPDIPFFPIVSSGPNSANPHASPSTRPLKVGDLLVIDYGARVSGYCSDITRTFAIGKIDQRYQEIASVVLRANTAAREAVKPGVHATSVDEAARSVIEDEGYGEYFFHRTGHGLGLEGHEEPYIRNGNDQILEIGMAFTIEPGIYIKNRNGVRIEDDVVVTPTGIRCLTSLPRELITL